MASVYIESTIPSYLAAFPSRDLIVAAHQQITHRWWHSVPGRFDVFISEAVLDEVRQGDPDVARRRIEILSALPILAFHDEIAVLSNEYRDRLGLPARASADLLHIAYAVVYEMDFLVTWNCRHIANGEVIRRLAEVNAELGRFTPIIVTPEELVEPDEDDGHE